MFMAVPRIWEKFEDALKAAAATKPAFMQAISGWAKGKGQEKVMAQMKGQDPPMMYNLAEFAILRRIKQIIGLDQTILFFFGAAPLKKTSVDYFASLDMPLFNMYGLSETTGTTTWSNPVDFSLEHAGEILPSCHIKLADMDEKG
jgi:long-chain-fatty-acid--CoA ligase ACSBG